MYRDVPDDVKLWSIYHAPRDYYIFSLSGSKMEIALEILRPLQNQEEHLQVYWEGFLPDPKEKRSRMGILTK